MHIFRNKKGQASAPFEVLVAVILMGFVILAGTWALTNLSENTCIGDKRQKLSELREVIKDVVLGSDLTIKNLSFDTRPCFNQKYEKITIKTYDSPAKCAAFCGGGHTCTLIEYVYEDNKTRKVPIQPICLELPTSFELENNPRNCGINNGNDDWAIFDGITNNITSGRYRLFMVSSFDGGSSRKLCFLRKKRI